MNLAGAGIYLISTIASLYVLLLLLRFLLRLSGADYYNPISQGIVSITDPVVKPLSVVIPTLGRVDLATLLVAVVVQLLALMLIAAINGGIFFHPLFVGWAMVGVLSLTLNIYFFALLVVVIASWIAPGTGHPILTLAVQITDPITRPVRKVLPPMGGLDFSVMAVIMGLVLLEDFLLIPTLAGMLQLPPGLMLGL